MKLSGFRKLLTVSVFLFSLSTSTLLLPVSASAQASSLVSPTEAEAQAGLVGGITAVKSMYDLWCSVKEFQEGGKFECETHRQPYISSLIGDLVFDTITLMVWNQTTGDVFTEGGEEPFTYGRLFAATKEDSMAYNEILDHGRVPYGYTSMTATSLVAFQAGPPVPTDMALFIKDNFKDTMLGTPAFAANPLEINYRLIVLEGWKITRNLALTLLGFILALVGLMIIFRSKLAPQVTVSIYNVLPTLPIAIALIVLSYPLISLALSAIGPLLDIANQIGYQLVANVLPVDAQAVITEENSLAVTVVAALKASWEIFVTLGGVSSINTVFFLVALLLAVLVGSVYFFWTVAKVFMSFIITTIVSPLVMVMSVLPGKQGLIMNLIKRVAVDMLSLPAMVVGAYIAFAMIAYTPTADSLDVSYLPGFVAVPAAGLMLMIPLIIKGFIGLGFLFGIRKIPKALESNFGVSGLFGGGDAKDSKGPPRR